MNTPIKTSIRDLITNNPFDTFFEDIISKNVFMPSNNKSFPKYNIQKNDDGTYVIELALAGFEKNDVSVNFSKGILSISGQKEENDHNYVQKNISNRNFEIHFHVSNEVEVKRAKMENGLLFVTLEKLDQDDSQTIEIE